MSEPRNTELYSEFAGNPGLKNRPGPAVGLVRACERIEGLDAELQRALERINQLSQQADAAYAPYRTMFVSLRVEVHTLEIERDALKDELDELREYLNFHPRAAKLMQKRKNFVVVAEDEPYYIDVYRTIRENEIHEDRWTGQDEEQYKAAIAHAALTPPDKEA